jgi:glycine cleavage system H lipoate-binding protein
MVVIGNAATLVGTTADVQITNVVQTGAGKLVFAELRGATAAAPAGSAGATIEVVPPPAP